MESPGCSYTASSVESPASTSPSKGTDVVGYPVITEPVYATLDRLLDLEGADVNNAKELKKILMLTLKPNDTHSITPIALDFKNEKRLLHLDIMISNELYNMDIWLATYFAVTLDLKCSLVELREFFEDEFYYRTDLTTNGSFVDRIYIYENSSKFSELPMRCRHFIFKCMMSAPTNKDYVDLPPNWKSPYPKDEGLSPEVLKELNRLFEKHPADQERLDFYNSVLTALSRGAYPEAGMVSILLWSNLNTARDLLDFNDELAAVNHNGLMLLYIVSRLSGMDSALTLQHYQVILGKLKCYFTHRLSSDCPGRAGYPINRTFYQENQQFFEAMPPMCYNYFVSIALEVGTTMNHMDTFLDISNMFTRDVREFSFL